MNGDAFRAFLRTILFLPPEASTAAVELDTLHYFVISVTMIGAGGVGLVATILLVRYYRRKDRLPTPRVEEPLLLEVGAIAGLLVLFITWWAIGYAQYLRIHDVPDDTLEVYVTGKQWMWKFAYTDGRSTAGVLVVPQDEPVRLMITSRDVIHSFYVPAFRLKRDAVPGRYTMMWFQATEVGSHRILCAEYCGQAHSRMWGRVVVLPRPQYERWLDGEVPRLVAEALQDAPSVGQQALGHRPAESLAERGLEAATRYGCMSCHTLDGQDHIGPTWRGLYRAERELTDGRVVLADEDYLTQSMMDPNVQVVAGYESVMPSYAGVLNPRDVAPILELIKSLRVTHEPPAIELPRTRAAPDTGGVPDMHGPGGADDVPQEDSP
jgi:cytochrome c oxidase subunit II